MFNLALTGVSYDSRHDQIGVVDRLENPVGIVDRMQVGGSDGIGTAL